MIETTTTTSVSCDHCGRQLLPGETFYQVHHSVAAIEYDGGPVSNVKPVSDLIAQLCETDYQATLADVAAVAPRATPLPVTAPVV